MLASLSHFKGFRRDVILLVGLAIWSSFSCYRGFGQTDLYQKDMAFSAAMYGGHFYETPGYPMWGYPLLLGIVGNYVLIFQFAAVAAVVLLVTHSIAAHYGSRQSRLTEAGISVLIVILMAPWLYAVLAYSSCAPYSLLLVASYLALIRLKGETRRLQGYAISGLFLGLAYNFRTEALLISGLIIATICAAIFRSGVSWKKARVVGIFASVLSICIIPYLTYTTLAFGAPRITTTNGGGTFYDQLGILPNNPWNIYPSDEFAEEQSNEFTDQGPWSLEADRVFKRRFVAAVAAHPGAFVLRALVGLKEMLKNGLMVPEVETLLAMNRMDAAKVYLARQEIKVWLGFRPNPYKINDLANMGVEMKDIRMNDRALILAEFFARAFYVCLWTLVLAAWPIGCYRKGLFAWDSLITTAYLGAFVLISMFVVAGVRYSTPFLPIAVIFALHSHARIFDRRQDQSTVSVEQSQNDEVEINFCPGR